MKPGEPEATETTEVTEGAEARPRRRVGIIRAAFWVGVAIVAVSGGLRFAALGAPDGAGQGCAAF